MYLKKHDPWFLQVGAAYKRCTWLYTKNESKNVLTDGEKLAAYMIDYKRWCINSKNVYEIKKVVFDYFEEE